MVRPDNSTGILECARLIGEKAALDGIDIGGWKAFDVGVLAGRQAVLACLASRRKLIPEAKV
jgi:hypothetical protein